MKKIIAIIYLLFLTILPLSVEAQVNGDITYDYTISDSKAVDGDILIYTDKGLVRADTTFSSAMFGVMQLDPIISIQLDGNEGQPVAKTGIANVNVTNINGPIKKGDYITSSAVTGKGQKAEKSGYMIGTALADFSNSGDKMTVDGKSISSGQIPVSLNVQYVDLYSNLSPAANKFLKSLDSILLASIQDPTQFTRLVRYLVAAVIVLGAFIISFFTFSKSMAKSVEAIGRNPLAKNSIYFSLLVNVFVTVITIIAGLATAYILIKL